MKLTDEQREAVRCEGNLMLTACPGSGKTRVIISKLARAVDEVRDTPRAVACITYTNAAVHEIEARLRYHIQPGDDSYFDICTIHSFCLNHIFRRFCYLIPGYRKGFRVLAPGTEEFEEHVKAIYSAQGRPPPGFREFDDFAQLRISLDGKPVGPAITRGGVTPQMALDYWKRIREAGLIDFAHIVYLSLLLLRRRKEILRYVSAKFAWILIDEFQDTTDLQVEMLTLIAKEGQTRFFLVGDPFQSIFGFAGARPDLADQFAKEIKARIDLKLSGNFRSSKPIVKHANSLFARTPAMVALGDYAKFTEPPTYRHGASAFTVITDHFLPAIAALKIPIGNAAILAPTWFTLFPLGRRLREYGVKIVGPGARPYRRTSQFAPLAEQICGYLMEPRPDAISGIERTLFSTLLDVVGRAHFEIFSYRGRTLVFRLIEEGQRLQQRDIGGVAWLEEAAAAFTRMLTEEGLLGPSENDLFVMSVEEMKSDMRRNDVDLDNLTIDELGIYASPDSAMKLSTLHNAKGREYKAVAMIDLHEGKIPFWAARSNAEIDEAKRLFYVGVTRAQRLLLYVTDSSGTRDGPTRFLKSGTGVGIC